MWSGVRQEEHAPAEARRADPEVIAVANTIRRTVGVWIGLAGRWVRFVDAFVIMQRQTDLLEVVRALGPRGRRPHLLNRGKEQSHEDGDDRNHDE